MRYLFDIRAVRPGFLMAILLLLTPGLLVPGISLGCLVMADCGMACCAGTPAPLADNPCMERQSGCCCDEELSGGPTPVSEFETPRVKPVTERNLMAVPGDFAATATLNSPQRLVNTHVTPPIPASEHTINVLRL